MIDNIAKKVFFKKDIRKISGNDALKFHKIFNDKKIKLTKRNELDVSEIREVSNVIKSGELIKLLGKDGKGFLRWSKSFEF